MFSFIQYYCLSHPRLNNKTYARVKVKVLAICERPSLFSPQATADKEV
jgi:hypothetical protein